MSNTGTSATNLHKLFTSGLGYEPTSDQDAACLAFADFLSASDTEGILILNGYAGTGKTTLLKTVTKTLSSLKVRTELIAPTGRAAKVLGSYCQAKAFTIHKRIYRQQKAGEGRFVIGFNPFPNTVFIVDEASMISNQAGENTAFGTGRLLDDLIQFVFAKPGCKLILVGDQAQLPPVGCDLSPALDKGFVQGYGYPVSYITLSEVVRQTAGSGILTNATEIRRMLLDREFVKPQLKTKKFNDVLRIGGAELIETLSGSYDQKGIDDTIVICRSNKNANLYNQGIRNRIFWREEELSSGDQMMVVKNNYFWLGEKESSDFIANGDIFSIQRIQKYEDMYGFRFCNAAICLPDYGIEDLQVKLMMDSISAEGPSISAEKSKQLFEAVMADYADAGSQKDKFEMLKRNPYFNALQVKFGYAVTCHKAQGGQWDTVFVDQGFMREDALTC